VRKIRAKVIPLVIAGNMIFPPRARMGKRFLPPLGGPSANAFWKTGQDLMGAIDRFPRPADAAISERVKAPQALPMGWVDAMADAAAAGAVRSIRQWPQRKSR
jgi:hypothetical protein